ncbi:MAG TPA: heme exporter protein CcmD [Burkholderiales bacterium]|nr:heme exporter protein CcmD [Burkholderiales bacterium]
MNWGSFGDFLAMGGYGLYVWGSYGVVAGLIAIEVVFLALRRRNILNHLGLMAKSRGRKSGAA